MNVSEDLVTSVFSGMNFEDILDYLIQEVKIRNYLITRVSNIDIIITGLIYETIRMFDFSFKKTLNFSILKIATL